MSNRLPEQSSHKAVAAAIGAWIVYGLARATGMFEAPPVEELRDLTLVALEGLVPAIVAGGFAWITPNRPRDDGSNAGAPEGGRLRSPIGAGIVAVLATLMLGGCWLTARVDDATGTTLTQRCAFYAGIIDGIMAARAADGFITSDQAVRLALYRGLRDQYCTQVEIDGAAP